MNRELSLKWWPWGGKDKRYHKEQDAIDNTLDRIAELRKQVDANLRDLRAAVNSEDLWFKCYQVTEDHQEGANEP